MRTPAFLHQALFTNSAFTFTRDSDAAAPLKFAWATPGVMCGSHTVQVPVVSPGR